MISLDTMNEMFNLKERSMSKHEALTDDELKQAIKDAYENSSKLGRREYYRRNAKKCVASALNSLRDPMDEQAELWKQGQVILKEIVQHMETEIRLISPVAQAADNLWRELLEEEKLRARRVAELHARISREETIKAELEYDRERKRNCHCPCGC